MEKFYGDMTTMTNRTNREILDIYLNDGTLRTCVECQFAKIPNKEFMEDFFNDMVLLILEYDNHKLNNVHNNGHFNAWATRIIINNLFSTTSAYYRTYVRYGQRNEELDETYDNIADTDEGL